MCTSFEQQHNAHEWCRKRNTTEHSTRDRGELSRFTLNTSPTTTLPWFWFESFVWKLYEKHESSMSKKWKIKVWEQEWRREWLNSREKILYFAHRRQGFPTPLSRHLITPPFAGCHSKHNWMEYKKLELDGARKAQWESWHFIYFVFSLFKI